MFRKKAYQLHMIDFCFFFWVMVVSQLMQLMQLSDGGLSANAAHITLQRPIKTLEKGVTDNQS